MATSAQGLKRIAQGNEAEMFEWSDGRILRLYREGQGADAGRQARLLEIARACGVRVPESFGQVEVDGRAGVVIERVAGPDLLTELNGKPWHILQIAGVWGRLQADINSRAAPPELEPLRSRLRRMINGSPLVPDDLRGPALECLGALPDGDRLLHGDLHPANIMRNGKEIVVIDWSNATRGVPEADYFRGFLMGSLGNLPPGTPWHIRTFAGIGRRIVRDGYVRAYRRLRKPDEEAVAAWRLPVIVARFAEGLEPEFPTLDAYARRVLNDRALP